MSWSSGLNSGGVRVLLPQLRPWQRVEWRSCIQSQIYRDWGVYYTRRLLDRTALESFGRAVTVCKEEETGCPGTHTPTSVYPSTCLLPRKSALAPLHSCLEAEAGVCPEDYKSLFLRSRCQRTLARPELALLDVQRAQRAMEVVRHQRQSCVLGAAEIIAEKCEALVDANEFESALTTLYMEGRPFRAQFTHGPFGLIEQKTLGVFEDTLGESLVPFMQQHRGVLEEVSRRQKEQAAHVPRLLRKELRDRQQCDVQSVLVKEPERLTPLERAHRRLSERLYNYNCMGRSAVDVALLRRLRSDRNFLDPLRLSTTPPGRQLSEEQYTIVRRFMKMVHARNPLYNRRYVRQRHGRIGEQERRRNREMHLFHAQYQTRRDCLKMLQEMHRRRREGDVDKLSDYVEQTMSDYFEVKTHRTLPWKWEFLNDVYNTLALAHCDRCAVPANVDFLEPYNRHILYLLRPEKVRAMTVSFGGSNIYLEIDREEERHRRINQKLEHLENRLRHSRYPIERSYLFFEIARCHFKESRFDKVLVLARKAFNEARKCNCLVWQFNSIFLGCQVHAVLNRFERLKESLGKASQLASDLRAPKLVAYIAICINVNNYELAIRRLRQSDVTVRRSRKRSPASTATISSQASFSSIVP
ncbi:outer dynein arm-docking complex subunit 4 [Drosophila rhopaloa]|uniref:Tetratricopeptide repeat protein 25 n=1 Tax=Drosophila rhopaloa TaxID=1041015 RepID=A0A6P4F3K4_DRORH|nr:outer dynein arm-docking complex subunit 4 [Drosophila rhopaloa]